jgi:ubiquinone/menaquinone biosynthesis C-methylase UbiE
MAIPALPDNASTIEAWNTVLFDKFCRYAHLLIEGLGQHGSKLFEHFPPAPGARVLDVGCGFGDTTVQLAELLGDRGEAVGVDCAANFVAAADKRASRLGAPGVRFLRADVQVDDLGGPYDAAYSRFGTMFFDSPVAALRNIRRSLRPGGTLHMSVWRKRQDNPCFYVAQQVVEQFISQEDKATDQVTCGPGPFSMAGPDMVSDQLLAAGFVEPSFLRFDAPMCMGRTVDEALGFARDLGPAGEAIRLASQKAGDRAGEIEAALRKAFEPLVRDDGVWATSSTWLIRAQAAE